MGRRVASNRARRGSGSCAFYVKALQSFGSGSDPLPEFHKIVALEPVARPRHFCSCHEPSAGIKSYYSDAIGMNGARPLPLTYRDDEFEVALTQFGRTEGRRSRSPERDDRRAISAVCLDQARWHGARAFDLSLDRRGARRPTLERTQSRWWNDFSLLAHVRPDARRVE